MPRQFTPAAETRAEILVVNSRFIATLAHTLSIDEARAFIARVKTEMPDATHHVPAFVLGHGASVTTHCSDDGEPAGTAGRPVLSVLLGSGLGDATVVVTRYFGGTKLGTGGLVRAYGDAVRAVLATTPRAEKIATQVVMLSLPYSLYERVRGLIFASNGTILDVAFGGEVTITARLRLAQTEVFRAELRELSHGTLDLVVLETDLGTLVPVLTASDS